MKSVFRVHSTVRYLPGHDIYEKAKRDAGQYWKEGREINATKWDIVTAQDCRTAIRAVEAHYDEPGTEVKRVWSVSHIGDVTIEAAIRLD